jgi:hypothetical protein
VGFTLETEYRLFFEDDDLAGLEVTMSSMTILQVLAFDETRFRDAATPQEIRAKYEALADQLGEHLISWNLEDRAGIPVPADAKGILAQPERLMTVIVNAYVQALRGVPAPLELPSDGGQPSGPEALTLPMEPL